MNTRLADAPLSERDECALAAPVLAQRLVVYRELFAAALEALTDAQRKLEDERNERRRFVAMVLKPKPAQGVDWWMEGGR